MFASLVQGPLLRLFSVGLIVLALQRTLFADLRPAGVSLQVDAGPRRRGRRRPAARRRAPWPGSCSG